MSPVDVVKLAADKLPVAIWLGDATTGHVAYVNDAFREVLGIQPPPDAARGTFVEPYGVHLPDGSAYPEDQMPFERVLAARAMVVVDDIVIHRRDGRKVNLRVFAKPIFDEAGHLTHVLEAFTDITREMEAERARIEGERRLARSQRLESIGQLVAGIAHDFNNLLTVSKLLVARLTASEADPSKKTALADLDTATESAIALIKSLLEFAGRARSVLEPIDLHALVGPVVYLASRTFDRRITLTTDFAATQGAIKGDRSRLEQVFMNLLVNARDAMPDGGEIVVRTRNSVIDGAAHVVCEVADTGTGIPPQLRERVFEPYFTTKTVGAVKGTGLGLSIVHGVVSSHHGHVELSDNSPRGTVVRLSFPATGVEAPAPARPASGTAPRGNGELVLLVEDDRLVRDAAATLLTSLGYRVVEARNSDEVLAAVDARRGELRAMILDLVVPGIGARELHQQVDAKLPSLPIIVVTGTVDDDDVAALVLGGVRAVLTKPFRPELLASTLRDVLDQNNV